MAGTRIDLDVKTERLYEGIRTESSAVVEDPDPIVYEKAVEITSIMNRRIALEHSLYLRREESDFLRLLR